MWGKQGCEQLNNNLIFTFHTAQVTSYKKFEGKLYNGKDDMESEDEAWLIYLENLTVLRLYHQQVWSQDTNKETHYQLLIW